MGVTRSECLVGDAGGEGAEEGEFGLVLFNSNIIHTALEFVELTVGEPDGVVDFPCLQRLLLHLWFRLLLLFFLG